MADLSTIIDAAQSEDTVGMRTAFDDLMREKVATILDQVRHDSSNAIFSGGDEENDENN